jgi:hypothetical protein
MSLGVRMPTAAPGPLHVPLPGAACRGSRLLAALAAFLFGALESGEGPVDLLGVSGGSGSS